MNKRFVNYAWGVVGYTILVILWGTVVRATGSGAGCGNHWPRCNGEIIPTPESIETMIEFAHRLTSGLAGVLVLALAAWAWRAYPAGAVRRWAGLSLFFIIVEGWVGMLLVRLELVQDNASTLRAVVIALHLINTFLLLGSLSVTAWLAGRGGWRGWRAETGLRGMVVFGLVAAMGLSAAGAVTALGDTLFPAESLAAGLQQDLDPTAHFLIQLRVIHPALALMSAVYLFWLGGRITAANLGAGVERWVTRLYAVMGLQILVGFVNVALLAPVWMQVIHLLLADLFWLALLLLAAETLSEPTA
ncbi:MAG: heme A synthase [Anaerolineae bacterium]|nr:MAG: heme A synthase [Anaerolineae bacterium]